MSSNHEPFDRTAMNKVFFHDLLDIRFIDVAVPDPLRIDHGNGSFRAAVETPRLIHPHTARTIDTQLLDQMFCIFAQPF